MSALVAAWRWTVLVALTSSALPLGAAAQSRGLTVRGPTGSLTLPVESGRGYAVLADTSLERLGWRLEIALQGVDAALPRGTHIRLGLGTPFFRWGEDLLQLTDEPYADEGRLYVPLQLVVDFLPARLDSIYRFDEEAFALDVLDPEVWSSLGVGSDPVAARSDPEALQAEAAQAAPEPEQAEAAAPVLPLVVIDAGHGGRDPGARGPSGHTEKDLALRIARSLARELRKGGDLDVRLTRDGDVLVPLWDRGRQATDWKGDRPGVFISLHANALPGQRSVRGFETYFLSEARTDHERRVAEIENAPLELEEAAGGDGDNPDLDFILRELRNLDHQHWSALLAESVQSALESVHTGPSRGVKQGPFAVITNALMPAVLVELGFLTNRQDERLLAREDFQEDAARSIAGAIRGFLERYPPGRTVPGGRR